MFSDDKYLLDYELLVEAFNHKQSDPTLLNLLFHTVNVIL